jgi:hypothetical protein
MNAIKLKVMQWTEAEMQQLRNLVEVGGLTTVQMAAVFGISKSALIGKKNRMGLTRPENNPMKNREKASAIRKFTTAKKRRKAKRARDDLLSGYDANAPKMPNGTGCRDIEGEPTRRMSLADFEKAICGQKLKAGSCYCEYHHAHNYIPKKKKQPNAETVQ